MADHTINHKFSIFTILLKVFVNYDMEMEDFSCIYYIATLRYVKWQLAHCIYSQMWLSIYEISK